MMEALDRKLTEMDAHIGDLRIRVHRIEQEAVSHDALAAFMRALDQRILVLESAAEVRKAKAASRRSKK